MAVTAAAAADYEALIAALMPRGPAWADGDALFTAPADEWARAHNRAYGLLAESDPRTTAALLPDWERVAGLPDPCVTDAQSTEQRRAALVARLTQVGGQSRTYFIGLAEALGYPGAAVTEFGPATCNGNCNDAVFSEAWRYAWRLDLTQETAIFTATCNSNCNDALRSWGNTALECVVSRLKPAHSTVLFAYGV